MKRINHSLCRLLAAVLFGGVAQTSVAAVTLTLRESVVVPSSVVRLGDVAEVAAADRAHGRQLAALPLMPAPVPNTGRYLTRQELAQLLAARGYDLREFQIEGAARVAISSTDTKPIDSNLAPNQSTGDQPMNRHAAILANRIGGASNVALHEALAAKLRDQLNGTIARYIEARSSRAGNWRIVCDVPAHNLALLQAATSPVVCQGGREPWIGRQRFVISFTTAHGTTKFPVHAEVAGESARVAVAIRPIARGDVITAADVELQPLESSPVGRRTVIESLEQLVGMEARQAISMGSMIFADQLQAPLLVKRGEEITVVSQSGGIRVRTTARARQDGSHGQLVQVESLESKERYDVRVVGLREAAVFTATGLASIPPSSKAVETAKR